MRPSRTWESLRSALSQLCWVLSGPNLRRAELGGPATSCVSSRTSYRAPAKQGLYTEADEDGLRASSLHGGSPGPGPGKTCQRCSYSLGCNPCSTMILGLHDVYHHRFGEGHNLGTTTRSPSSALVPFFGAGFPTEIDYGKRVPLLYPLHWRT